MINACSSILQNIHSTVIILAVSVWISLFIYLFFYRRKVSKAITYYRKNSENYQRILDESLDVFYRTDVAGKLVLVNNSITRLLGYDSPEECIGMDLARDMYYNPSERENLISILKERGSVLDYETVLRRKDGTPVIVATSSHFYYDSNGKPAGVEGIVRDITERKMAEDMFNRAFHDNPCSMSISSIDTGFYIEVNKAWLENLEFEKEEVIGKSVFELNIYNNPADRNRVVESIKATGKVPGIELEFLSKTGKKINGVFFGEIIIVAGKKMLLSAVLNITEQRKAEKALISSEERFRRLAENAPDMIYRMRLPDGQYEYANPVTESITGYKPSDIYMNPKLIGEIIHPDWKEYFRREWGKLLEGDISPAYEYKIITRSGKEKWIHQRNVLIKNENGTPAAIEGIVTDVTVRKNIEEELRLKNAILSSEQEVSLDGILIVDQKGKILTVNRRFVEIWRIPEELISEDDDKKMLNYALSLLDEPDYFLNKVNYLYSHTDEKSGDEILFKDGRIIERYSAPVKTDDGVALGRVWYFRDISERKRSEDKLKRLNEELAAANEELMATNEEFEAQNEELIATNLELEHAQKMLKDSEKEYRSLVENISIGIIVYNSCGSIILTNPSAISMVDGIRDNMNGKSAANPDSEWLLWDEEGSLIDPEFVPERIVLNTGMPVKNKVIGMSTATSKISKWFLCNAYPEFDQTGVISKVIGTFFDITELKRAEEEVQTLKNYMRNIIDSIPDMLVGLDPEMNIMLINKKTEKVSGILMEEAIGCPVQRVLGDFSSVINNMKSDLKDRNVHSVLDFPVEKNGDRRYYNLMLYPLVANEIEGAVVRIEDITDSRKKDEQLRQAQKMETVGTLAGGLAHDFNNVLSGIVGTVSLIKHVMERDALLNERFIKYIELIDKSGKRAAEMVQQLLTLSKRYEVTLKPLDLNSSVRNVIQICNNTFDKSIEIKAQYSEKEAVIAGDPSQIEQVILNLCINASHAMTIMRSRGEKHGGVLSVSLRKVIADSYFCSVHPDAHPGGYWLVSHCDTGVGIDNDIIRNIFDPFFTTKVREQGTGLGLTMVYSIVHQHGGFIDVYSEKGTGSTFNVYFPELIEHGITETDSLEASVEKGEGVVLVIDDEQIVRSMAESVLKECGYTVILAENGIEGIIIFRRFSEMINVVLLDMAMPGISGKDVYIELKRVKPDVKVLLASGFRQDVRVDEAMELGINDFIQKPYSIFELSRKIKSILINN